MSTSRTIHYVVALVCLVGMPPSFAPHSAAAAEPAAAVVEWRALPSSGVISEPGRYYLEADIATDRLTAVKIEADDVTLDLRGHAIRYTGEPKEGNFGVVAQQRKGVTITNGAVGGFWFNMHFPQNERLRVQNIRFDDIPYIGINVATSDDVVISDNVFDNFRYDIPKAGNSTYLVAINIGAKDAVVSKNRFVADLKGGAAKDVALETVFVLFSAEVTKGCVVTKNYMWASDLLPRSYGVWLASNGQASIVDNSIHNMQHGVCLASNATGLVSLNHFSAEPEANSPLVSIGVNASGAREVFEAKNTFEGIATPLSLPNQQRADDAVSG